MVEVLRDANRLDPDMHAFLKEAGFLPTGNFRAEPLTGGVASDIWKVTTREGVVVVKKALARLRVSQIWEAPVSRNASEVEWMREQDRMKNGIEVDDKTWAQFEQIAGKHGLKISA